ncbi:MAG: signal peptidase I [Candidatus Marinimicrobia bacterium]|nr:signal peptidase I [Candidatus Neomarinimicrobiota bacterium]|tara:strand:- start:324 stop:2000 length:1677 start_codon:yes stop_codon:yes gene_type:complete
MKLRIPKSVRNFLILIVIAFFVKTSILEVYVVPTGSMLDTIEINDAIIGNKFIYGLRTPNWLGIPFTRNGVYIPSFRLPAFKKVQNGDVSIFEFPNDDYVKYVKRCIGLPGQYVEIKDGEIFLGESLGSLQYRQDLTYPPQSKFTKERQRSFEVMKDSSYTEKSITSLRIGDVFPYYSPIDDSGTDVIDLDNMRLQVPHKGMEIDLNDSKMEFSSALMLLLLDGYDIKLEKYSDVNLGIKASEEYTFHKYDYESMAQTSITIKNWFTGLAKGRFTLPIMLLIIVYTGYVLVIGLFNPKKKYPTQKKISQSLFCVIVVSLILTLSNRNIMSYNDYPLIALNNINSDIENGSIPLTYFFDYKIRESPNYNIQKYSDYIKKQRDIDGKLSSLIQAPEVSLGNQSYTEALLPVLRNLYAFKDYSLNELRKKVSMGDYNYLANYRKKGKISKYFNDSKFEYEINTLIYDYYKYENTINHKMNKHNASLIKQQLIDNILIDGEPISKRSKFTLNHDYYFMVGDNHNNSKDSRSWGFVPDYNLLGQPVITLVNFAKLKLKFDFLL